MAYQEKVIVLLEEFMDYLLAEETVCSLAIEKVKVELEELREGLKEEPRLRQAWNYYRTAEDLYSLAIKGDGRGEIINQPVLLWTYEKLWKGFNLPKGYRTTHMTIFGAKFEPPPPGSLTAVMRRILLWLKGVSLDPIRKASIFHILFEVIHPFVDGNGRIGRILMNALLIEGGLLNVAFRNREDYIKALRESEEGAVVVVEKLARGRKLTNEQITRTVIELGNTESFENLIRSELLYSLRVYAGEKNIMLAPEQASQLLGYKNADYIRVLINRGLLKGVKKNGKWRVHLRDLIDFAEKRKEIRAESLVPLVKKG